MNSTTTCTYSNGVAHDGSSVPDYKVPFQFENSVCTTTSDAVQIQLGSTTLDGLVGTSSSPIYVHTLTSGDILVAFFLFVALMLYFIRSILMEI